MEQEMEWARIYFHTLFLCQAHVRAKTSFSLTLLCEDVSENTPEEIWVRLCPCHIRLLSLPFTRDGSDVTTTWLLCLQNVTNAHSWEKNSPAHGGLILENRSGLMALQPRRQRSLFAVRLNTEEVLHLWAFGGVCTSTACTTGRKAAGLWQGGTRIWTQNARLMKQSTDEWSFHEVLQTEKHSKEDQNCKKVPTKTHSYEANRGRVKVLKNSKIQLDKD